MCEIINKQQMTYRDLCRDILWEIFQKMSEFELAESAELCSEFAEIIEDPCLWRNVCIQYLREWNPTAFESLFTGPCPIDKISFRDRQISPPVSTEIHQVEVRQLDFNMGTISSTSKPALQALVAKYPCKELVLDFVDVKDHIIHSIIKAVSEQNKFEMLTLRDVRRPQPSRQYVLKRILRTCCSNLKVLNLSQTILSRNELSIALKKAPSSLEKVGLYNSRLKYTDLATLAESCPNLKELELEGRYVAHLSLVKFNFLESLHIDLYLVKNLTWLHRHLIKLPKLKSVYVLSFNPEISENMKTFCGIRGGLRNCQKDFILHVDQRVIQEKTEKLKLIMEPVNIKVEMECVTVSYVDWEEPAWFKYKKHSIYGLSTEHSTKRLMRQYIRYFIFG